MANLTTRGWTLIQQPTDEKIPYGGVAIYTKGHFENGLIRTSIQQVENQLFILHLTVSMAEPVMSNAVKLVWKVPAINLKGMWTSNYDDDRRIRAEFDGEDIVVSRTAYESPVLGLFGHDDSNVHSFACSDAINVVSLGAGLREEDGWVYCNAKFFTEPTPVNGQYAVSILLDYRPINYATSLANISDWWASNEVYKPLEVPESAKLPMYSTWYSYHQGMTDESMLKECKLAGDVGYKGIIIDDGWQNSDTNRGYANTGDWFAERFKNTPKLVQDIQSMGMKVMFWYSVPFFGRESNAFKKFEGKFLHWSDEFDAAIIDPRYPEIREYLINIYVQAVRDWKLDGLKLDFIDHIITYPKTILTAEDGRDYASINEAVNRLMTDIVKTLTAEKPDIMIEFRQHYIGPAMRSFGNMFRAHDCPNDAVTNRKRITDLRLLMGDSAVHADMFMWNYEEPAYIAALQLSNTFFSVPQLSVRLNDISTDHQKMVRFYTRYWLENRSIFLNEKLTAIGPLESYPVLSAKDEKKRIVAVYGDWVIELIDGTESMIDLVNAKLSDYLVIDVSEEMGIFDVESLDCYGEKHDKRNIELTEGVHKLSVPPSGIVKLAKRI